MLNKKRAFAILSSILMICGINNITADEDQDWVSANHDDRNTNSSPNHKITPKNVKNLKLDWVSKPTIPNSPIGPIRFPSIKTPIVADGVVFYNDFSTSLFAAKVSDGTILWQFTPFTPAQAFSATFTEAVVDGNFVFASAGIVPTNGPPITILFKLNKSNGTVIWQTQVGDANTGQVTFAATSIVEDLVIVPTGTFSEDSLSPDPKTIGTLNAFNKHTGKFVWQFTPETGGGTTIESKPAFDKKRKLLFIGTSNPTFPPAGKESDAIIAIDFRTGKKKWSHQFTKNDVEYTDNTASTVAFSFKDLDVLASPNLFKAEDRDVVGINSKKGIYTAFDRSTGEIVWERNILGGFSQLLGNPTAAVAHDTVYTIASWTKDPFINPYTILDVAKTTIQPLLNYANDIFTNHTFTSIFALDTEDGHVKWRKDFKGDVIGSITESNGVLYTGTFDGRFLAFSAKNGKKLFQFQFPKTFTLCLGPPNICTTAFPNLPPTNLPKIRPNLYGDISIAENKVFVPVGFTDARIPQAFGITEGGLYVFSLHGKGKLPSFNTPKDPPKKQPTCKDLKIPCQMKKMRG